MEDAAESVAFSYVEAGDPPRIGDRWERRVQWAGVGNALMRSTPVAELLELPQRAEQVVMVPDEGAVQEFASAGLHPPFRESRTVGAQLMRWTHRRDRLPDTYRAIAGLVSDRTSSI
ncbi:hypothetical protein [Streptomyces olivochromogenes]|uniref:hypothetical protein n=1 Tax=Streptomyces olivochromogenes TaxID=1963 RepID=UPI001F3C927B|nr:hypothetical protein [Streptomyces olivochromogenes]